MIKSYDEAREYISDRVGVDNFRKYWDYFRSIPASRFAVIKIGGKSIGDENSLDSISFALSCLSNVGIYPVVAHGAGPQIDEEYTRHGITTTRIGDLRATPTMEPVLAGYDMAHFGLCYGIERAGGKVASLRRERIFLAKKMECKEGDLGFVGEITGVNDKPICDTIYGGKIPLVMPIGYDDDTAYNLNADHAVLSLYESMHPENVIFITEVGGVYDAGRLVSEMDLNRAEELMSNGVISGGMNIKIDVIKGILSRDNNAAVRIISPGNLLDELFRKEGCGTLIRR